MLNRVGFEVKVPYLFQAKLLPLRSREMHIFLLALSMGGRKQSNFTLATGGQIGFKSWKCNGMQAIDLHSRQIDDVFSTCLKFDCLHRLNRFGEPCPHWPSVCPLLYPLQAMDSVNFEYFDQNLISLFQ